MGDFKAAMIAFYIIINFCGCILGLATYDYRYRSSCENPVGKIEYVFPGFIFGCYMAKPFGEK
jgi:hypothetical protein